MARISETNQNAKLPDRRIERTRRLLRDSLIALILENGYDAVTIQAITDRVNLGRATFYLHFRDKDDLLLNSLQEIYDDLVATVERDFSVNGPGSGESLPGLVAFQHADQYRDLYLVILGDQTPSKIEHRIRDYLAGVIKQRLLTTMPEAQLPFPADLIAQHCAGSLMALIGWWLSHDRPYSAEYMAQNALRLMAPALIGQHPDAKSESR